jgi:hypothetical protein
VRGRVAWIAVAPVKGLALEERQEALLEPFGVRDNRRFYLLDGAGRLVTGKRLGRLVQVEAEYDEEREILALRFPGGRAVAGRVALGEPVEGDFFGRPVPGRLVEGPWSQALSSYAGLPLRLAQTAPGQGADRGPKAAVSLLSAAALEELARVAGVEHVDRRRFRMLFGVEGVPAHAEDAWLGRRVRMGAAVVLPRGHVGRCAVTTVNPQTGRRDLDTLGALAVYRGQVSASERLPFGVWGEVVEPGRVRLGDPVEVE